LQTIFRPKMHYIARFCIHNLKFFGVIPLEPCRGRGDPSRTHPSPWCLVPDTHFHLARQRSIVPVLRNDHWLEQHKCETGNIIRLIYVSLEIVEVRCAERKHVSTIGAHCQPIDSQLLDCIRSVGRQGVPTGRQQLDNLHLRIEYRHTDHESVTRSRKKRS